MTAATVAIITVTPGTVASVTPSAQLRRMGLGVLIVVRIMSLVGRLVAVSSRTSGGVIAENASHMVRFVMVHGSAEGRARRSEEREDRERGRGSHLVGSV